MCKWLSNDDKVFIKGKQQVNCFYILKFTSNHANYIYIYIYIYI